MNVLYIVIVVHWFSVEKAVLKFRFCFKFYSLVTTTSWEFTQNSSNLQYEFCEENENEMYEIWLMRFYGNGWKSIMWFFQHWMRACVRSIERVRVYSTEYTGNILSSNENKNTSLLMVFRWCTNPQMNRNANVYEVWRRRRIHNSFLIHLCAFAINCIFLRSQRNCPSMT